MRAHIDYEKFPDWAQNDVNYRGLEILGTYPADISRANTRQEVEALSEAKHDELFVFWQFTNDWRTSTRTEVIQGGPKPLPEWAKSCEKNGKYQQHQICSPRDADGHFSVLDVNTAAATAAGWEVDRLKKHALYNIEAARIEKRIDVVTIISIFGSIASVWGFLGFWGIGVPSDLSNRIVLYGGAAIIFIAAFIFIVVNNKRGKKNHKQQ